MLVLLLLVCFSDFNFFVFEKMVNCFMTIFFGIFFVKFFGGFLVNWRLTTCCFLLDAQKTRIIVSMLVNVFLFCFSVNEFFDFFKKIVDL